MRLKSHIKIANITLNVIKEDNEVKINKVAYLFGSIAPDLNVAFPKHSIKYTIKRWKRRLKRLEKRHPEMIKSFTLGVIMHYICDYFCYVHNIKSHGPKHVMYERELNKYLIDGESEIDTENNNMNKQWDTITSQLIKSLDCEISIITEQLIKMNKEYMKEVSEAITDVWYNDRNIMGIDIKYAEFMCKKIAFELVCN